jgi:tetratricopeptide (TPR) repeat protein
MNKHGKLKARMPGVSRTIALLLMFLFMMANAARADDAQDKIFAERAQAAYQKAQGQFQSQTNDPVLAWQFARTCYDWADCATNKTQRAEIAQEGIAACHQSLLLADSVAGHYYLAMDMGQLAQAETLGALKLVREMVSEFNTAAEIDPHFDLAGPYRGLGLLYRDAPGWPISIGNRRKAREYLEAAVTLAPNDPENILNLAESYLKWNDLVNAKNELRVLDHLWPQAQKDFTGLAWEQSWYDWAQRREALREKLSKP